MAAKSKLTLKRNKSRQQKKQHQTDLSASLKPLAESTFANVQELKSQGHDQFQANYDCDDSDFLSSKPSNVIPVVTVSDFKAQPKPKRVKAEVLSSLELDQIQLAKALSMSETSVGTKEVSILPKAKTKSKTSPKSLLESLTSDKMKQIISNRLDSVLEDLTVPLKADAPSLEPSKLTGAENSEPIPEVCPVASDSAGTSGGARLWSVAAYSESNPGEDFYVEPLLPLVMSDTAPVLNVDTMPSLQEVEDMEKIEYAIHHCVPAAPTEEEGTHNDRFETVALQTDMPPSPCCAGFAGLLGSSLLSDTRVLLQGDATMPGHAVVLYTRWPLFRKVLSEVEPVSPSFMTLDLQGCGFHLVRQLMEYLYTGSHGPDYEEMNTLFFGTPQTLSLTVSTTVLSDELKGEGSSLEPSGNTPDLPMPFNVSDSVSNAQGRSTCKRKSECHDGIIEDFSTSGVLSALCSPHDVSNFGNPSSMSPHACTSYELMDQSLLVSNAVKSPSQPCQVVGSTFSTKEAEMPATTECLTQPLPLNQPSSPGGQVESADECLLSSVPHVSVAFQTSQVSDGDLSGEVLTSGAEDDASDGVGNNCDSLGDFDVSPNWLAFHLDCPQVDFLLSPMTLSYEPSAAVEGPSSSIASGTPLTSRIHHFNRRSIATATPQQLLLPGVRTPGEPTPIGRTGTVPSAAGGVVSTGPVTPMPDYYNMATPWLKGQLSKFGLRPLSKKKMIAKLIEIYEYLHPTVEDSNGSDVPDSAPSQPTESSPIARPGGKGTRRKNKKDEVQPCTCQKKSAKASEDIHTKLFQYITSHEELYRDIVLYKTINFVEFHDRLSQDGIKISNPKLMDYLDKQCVTFTLPRPGK